MLNKKQLFIKAIKVRLPKWVRCPWCCVRQPFKKERENWKTVKDVSLDRAKILKVQTVYAKCLNPGCKLNSFALRGKFKRYQRATSRLKSEAVSSLIDDNSTLPRVSQRLNRSFNTTGSKSAIDRWKHKEASKYKFEDIIPHLNFSGILCFDEYKPKRSKTYDLIASDAIGNKILYIDNVPSLYYTPKFTAGSVARGHIEDFIHGLKELNIIPYAVIIDLATAYPKQIKRIYPDVIIQFDYFHVIQEIQKYIRNAVIDFRTKLGQHGLEEQRTEIWRYKWKLLKNMDNWTIKDHKIIEELISHYRGTIIEKALIFKEQIRDIFDNSKTKLEAYHKRYLLSQETYWQDSYHLKKIMKFISSWKFDYMITYLSHPKIPRSGNSESCIRIWRQMEKVRYGMSIQGRQNHLKLYQISKYLGGSLPETQT
jgi:hypothetical protein